MAFGTNQWQALTWGWLFGIAPTDHVDPATSLDYWLMANTAAIDAATRAFGPRFLLVGYDTLCANPEREARRIASLLGIELSPPQLTASPSSQELRARRGGGDASARVPSDRTNSQGSSTSASTSSDRAVQRAPPTQRLG